MKLRFDASMEEANGLFLAEHQAWDIVRRLKEQNEYSPHSLTSTTSDQADVACQPNPGHIDRCQ